MGSVAEWSKALDLSILLDSQWGKPARVRTSPLPLISFLFHCAHIVQNGSENADDMNDFYLSTLSFQQLGRGARGAKVS